MIPTFIIVDALGPKNLNRGISLTVSDLITHKCPKFHNRWDAIYPAIYPSCSYDSWCKTRMSSKKTMRRWETWKFGDWRMTWKIKAEAICIVTIEIYKE